MKPDYEHSLISTVMSIMNYYGVKPWYKTNKIIDELLSFKPKNVILLIFDGMGVDFLRKYFSDSILTKHIEDEVTSTFPPTTTAAIKSYMSGLTPLEHGWLGWSPYFKNVDMQVALLPYRDEKTGLKPVLDFDLRDKLAYKTIFEHIHEVNDVNMHTVQPVNIDEQFKYVTKHNYLTLDEMFSSMKSILNKDRNFIYCYHDNPDYSMHEYGPSSPNVHEQFQIILEKLTSFIDSIKQSDTLLLISADHGQIDINKNVEIFKDDTLLDMLLVPPSIEPRFASFHLKNNVDKEEFKSHFLKHYGDDFILFSKEEFLLEGYLGKGKKHEYVDMLLGDFVALGKSRAMIISVPSSRYMKGHHAGTLLEEMMVPIIAFKFPKE